MNRFITLIFATFLIFSLSKSIVIVVHGTFATEAEWCRPGGDFFTTLEREAIYLKEQVIPFTWSGKLNNKSRIQAAQALAKIILSYKQERIIIIGHSHGGNIINLASQLLAEGKPELPITYFSQIPHFIQAYKSVNRRRAKTKKEYLIDRVYLLATPIDTDNYAPNMKIIKHLYNFYSDGDKLFQKLLIFYKQTIDNLERVVNLQVMIEDPWEIKHPSHTQMHDPMIAKSILYIPEELQQSKSGGFENFSSQYNGIITFRENKRPKYIKTTNNQSDKITIKSSL